MMNFLGKNNCQRKRVQVERAWECPRESVDGILYLLDGLQIGNRMKDGKRIEGEKKRLPRPSLCTGWSWRTLGPSQGTR